MDDKMSLVYNIIIFKINFIVQRDPRLQKITPKVAVFQIPRGKVQGLDFTYIITIPTGRRLNYSK